MFALAFSIILTTSANPLCMTDRTMLVEVSTTTEVTMHLYTRTLAARAKGV